MEKISDHISWGEATKSQYATRNGIVNEPSLEHIVNMRRVANDCFEPLRTTHGRAIGISSFYRCVELNKAIGGSATSDHCKGCSIDVDADIYNNGISNSDIFHFFLERSGDIDFDQLILEYPDEKGEPRWVHISKRESGNRGQVLVATKKGYLTYDAWIETTD